MSTPLVELVENKSSFSQLPAQLRAEMIGVLESPVLHQLEDAHTNIDELLEPNQEDVQRLYADLVQWLEKDDRPLSLKDFILPITAPSNPQIEIHQSVWGADGKFGSVQFANLVEAFDRVRISHPDRIIDLDTEYYYYLLGVAITTDKNRAHKLMNSHNKSDVERGAELHQKAMFIEVNAELIQKYAALITATIRDDVMDRLKLQDVF